MRTSARCTRGRIFRECTGGGAITSVDLGRPGPISWPLTGPGPDQDAGTGPTEGRIGAGTDAEAVAIATYSSWRPVATRALTAMTTPTTSRPTPMTVEAALSVTKRYARPES